MALEIKDAGRPSGKKSKTKKSNVRVHFILDESGSMGCARQSTIDGFNEYINGLRNDKNGNKYVISLTKFEGGNVERVFTDLDLAKVRDITYADYCPCGGTNLNDAIGYTLQDMERRKLRWGKHNTLIIILTDGEENMSREWSQSMVADLIKKKESDGWTVTFLGANIDTQRVSRGYAISVDNARSYTTKGMRSTMANLSTATAAYASTATIGCSMSNMLSESVSGLTAADWMATDDENDIQNVSTTGISSVDLSGGSSLTVNGLTAEDFPSINTLVMGDVPSERRYGALDPKQLKRVEEKAKIMDEMDKKLREKDNG